MPVTAVYQIPLGLRTCLPRGGHPHRWGRAADISCGPPALKGVGDVERKGIVSALMAVDLHAVDPDGGIPVHRAEVQQDAIALAPVFGDVEGAAVPEPVVRADRLHHAGQSRLDRERHENLPVEITWLPVVLRPDRIVPQTVEVEPVLTDHLGPILAWALLPDIMGHFVIKGSAGFHAAATRHRHATRMAASQIVRLFEWLGSCWAAVHRSTSRVVSCLDTVNPDRHRDRQASGYCLASRFSTQNAASPPWLSSRASTGSAGIAGFCRPMRLCRTPSCGTMN